MKTAGIVQQLPAIGRQLVYTGPATPPALAEFDLCVSIDRDVQTMSSQVCTAATLVTHTGGSVKYANRMHMSAGDEKKFYVMVIRVTCNVIDQQSSRQMRWVVSSYLFGFSALNCLN